jgi:ribokinase
MPRAKQKAPAILVLGDVNADVIGHTQHWPKPGEECLADRLELHCGGVGANCALALRQWGVSASLIACIGKDPVGDFALKTLAAHRIDVRHIQRTSAALTGLLYINVTPDGQRTFFGSRGANCLVRAQRTGWKLLQGAKAASLMGYSLLDRAPQQAAQQILRAVRSNGGWVSLDVGMEPSQRIPGKILQVIRQVALLFLSDEEAAALTGHRNARDAFRSLQRAGAREIVMKLGKRGCLITDQGELQNVPAFAVRLVDSTGAGDAFTAAFLQARLRGWPTIDAAWVANAAGAVAVSVVGAGDRAPAVREIVNLIDTQRLASRWEALRLRVLRRLSRSV